MKKVYGSLALILVIGISFISFDRRAKETGNGNEKTLLGVQEKRDLLSGKKVVRNPAQVRGEIVRRRRILTLSEIERERAKARKSRKHEANEEILEMRVKNPISSDLEYNLLDGVYAIKDIDPKDYKVYGKKFGHYIVYGENVKPADSFNVVVSENKNLGIFTGVLKVKLTDINLADSILDGANYEITERYDHLHIVRIKFSSFESTMQAYETLKLSDKVRRVVVEILESERISR